MNECLILQFVLFIISSSFRIFFFSFRTIGTNRLGITIKYDSSTIEMQRIKKTGNSARISKDLHDSKAALEQSIENGETKKTSLLRLASSLIKFPRNF